MILTSQVLYPSPELEVTHQNLFIRKAKTLTNCKSNNWKNTDKNYKCVNRQKHTGEQRTCLTTTNIQIRSSTLLPPPLAINNISITVTCYNASWHC